MFIWPPPLCSRAVDDNDGEDNDSVDDGVGDDIAVGGGEGVHQVSWPAHPGLNPGTRLLFSSVKLVLLLLFYFYCPGTGSFDFLV